MTQDGRSQFCYLTSRVPDPHQMAALKPSAWYCSCQIAIELGFKIFK
jgi:hypothetical protein